MQEESRKNVSSDSSGSVSYTHLRGGKTLKGTQVQAGDLRGGAALLIAALMAEGETCVTAVSYTHLAKKCKSLYFLFFGICTCRRSADTGTVYYS